MGTWVLPGSGRLPRRLWYLVLELIKAVFSKCNIDMMYMTWVDTVYMYVHLAFPRNFELSGILVHCGERSKAFYILCTLL